MSNITKIINTANNMTILNKGFVASGLDQVLSDTEPFTLFAPANFTFKRPDKKRFENLMKPKSFIKFLQLIKYHFTPGKIYFNNFKNVGKLKAVTEKKLQFTVKQGRTNIEGSLIKNDTVQTSNRVIHSLDK